MNFSTEDDVTVKMAEIIFVNEVIKNHKVQGGTMSKIAEDCEYLQLLVALYFNSQISQSNIPPNFAVSHQFPIFAIF